MSTVEHGTQNVSIEEAFCDIVEKYSRFAYNIAFRMLRNAADAEDAVQEAFVSAYRAFPSFQGRYPQKVCKRSGGVPSL